jgi:hypothetical protein
VLVPIEPRPSDVAARIVIIERDARTMPSDLLQVGHQVAAHEVNMAVPVERALNHNHPPLSYTWAPSFILAFLCSISVY